MGKEKKEKRKSEAGAEDEESGASWEELLTRIGPIANPLASKKLSKKLYKCIKKAHKQKQIRKGVREVQKFLRKGEKGLVIFAGDTSPIEVICHLPGVCEDDDIPYCYTPSRDDLGLACGSKRPTCTVLIKPHEDYQDLYDECSAGLKELPTPLAVKIEK